MVGVIDPLDMTEESNDEDNDYKTKKTIKLSDEYIDTPDLIVKDFLLDLDAFPVYTEDASIDESGGSSIGQKYGTIFFLMERLNQQIYMMLR